TATLAQWQAALAAVTYDNLSSTPNTANRTLAFAVHDGALGSAPSSKTLGIVLPSLNPHLPGSPAGGSAGNSTGGSTGDSTGSNGGSADGSTGGATPSAPGSDSSSPPSTDNGSSPSQPVGSSPTDPGQEDSGTTAHPLSSSPSAGTNGGQPASGSGASASQPSTNGLFGKAAELDGHRRPAPTSADAQAPRFDFAFFDDASPAPESAHGAEYKSAARNSAARHLHRPLGASSPASSHKEKSATDNSHAKLQSVTAALAAGATWGSLRIGTLFASAAAMRPLWNDMDPIPLLSDDDEEEKTSPPDSETGVDFEESRDEMSARRLLDDGSPSERRPQ
ncbi:MAG: hypothetical protein ABW032_08615, partial [Burkholderiaceae bacterium]